MHASIAERFVYGHPLDPRDDEDRVRNAPRSTTALVGRMLLAAIFIVSGFSKLSDPASAIAYMNASGVPNASVLVYVAGVAELLGALALVFGLLTRVAAIGLLVYVAIIQFYFHDFWARDGQDAKIQMVQFVKNVAIIGGLLTLVAFGPGRASIDARIRRPLEP